MFLFEKDFVKEEEIIMTADADAFVIGDEVVGILQEDHTVWIAEWVWFYETALVLFLLFSWEPALWSFLSYAQV